MTVVDLRERLRRLDPRRRDRDRRDAELIRRIADKVEAGSLRAVSMEFEAGDDLDRSVDQVVLTLRSTGEVRDGHRGKGS